MGESFYSTPALGLRPPPTRNLVLVVTVLFMMRSALIPAKLEVKSAPLSERLDALLLKRKSAA